MDKEEMTKRITTASAMECPNCGTKLKVVPAKEMHRAHSVHEKARKCQNCNFMCYGLD